MTGNYGEAGKLWAMVAYPLPESEDQTLILFTHELFHRLQKETGFPDIGYDNRHMDNIQARTYIKLEKLAMLDAVNSKDKNTQAITDALIFRTYRRSLFKGSDSMENKFEIAEGLATYTSNKLCRDQASIVNAVNSEKEFYWSANSYVRAFGYYSGWLYSTLLDRYDSSWRSNLKYNSDLGKKLQAALMLQAPEITEKIVKNTGDKYGYDSIYLSEEKAKDAKSNILDGYRITFKRNPVVKFDLIKPHFGFNPGNVQPLDSSGTIYKSIELVDNWGILKVTDGGCLISNEWNKACVPNQDIDISGNIIHTKDWSLKLNEGWGIIKDGVNYSIKRVTPP